MPYAGLTLHDFELTTPYDPPPPHSVGLDS